MTSLLELNQIFFWLNILKLELNQMGPLFVHPKSYELKNKQSFVYIFSIDQNASNIYFFNDQNA